MDPKNATILDNKGVVFYHLGNYTGAITYYDRALTIDPSVVFASYDKGNALEALEKYSDAITYFDKALSSRSKSRSCNDWQGICT